MDERRQSPRQKTFLHGRIYFNEGRCSIDCLIRDVSYEGARIVVSDQADIPDEIELYIAKRKRRVLAQVRWRHANNIGLALSEKIFGS